MTPSPESSSKPQVAASDDSVALPLVAPLEQSLLFPDMLSEYREGKDELNLAEFPIAALSNRVDPGIKTIVFEDKTHDRSTGQLVQRSLTITASDAFGLPTAADDEVLLGLIQLTRQQGFRSPRVYFTLYQLLKVLGWSISTKNYRRINDALNRWLGVSLYYDNAWRDKGTGQWLNQKFHFLDNVEVYHPGQATLGPQGMSSIKWNEMIFRSFQSGNLKALDFQMYRRLETPIAKRMYRFLDKRFYQRSTLTFELEKFAFEKLGLPRSYVDSSQLKRRLLPGILELEQMQIICAEAPKDRFTKTRLGVWEVHFEKYKRQEQEQPGLAIEVEDLSPTEGRLVGHGVSKGQARKLVSEYDDERISDQLDALEYLLTRQDSAAPENRGGWLVKAIGEGFAPPRGFKTRGQREDEARLKEERVKVKAEAKKRREVVAKSREASVQAKEAAEAVRVEAYLATLSGVERQTLEREALKDSPFAKGRIDSPMNRAVIYAHVLRLLGG